jgi:hypothetical protein
MRAVFVELPAFARHRGEHLDEEEFRGLQLFLLRNPAAGPVIPDSGGLRKVRFADSRRGQGKRGGLRVIYFWWEGGSQFWLFAIYAKDEIENLSSQERRALRDYLKRELEARKS